jgi:hypothetical protein
LTHALVLVAVGLALTFALPAVAQKIYKQELPDGTVVYADHRIKGAKLLYQVTIPDPQTAPAARVDPSATPKADSAALDKRLRERGAALDSAQREIVDAERAVVEAKRRLEVGKELLPGEIQSSATGSTRVLPEYYERIKNLEDNVAKAQARLERAYSDRNQLR